MQAIILAAGMGKRLKELTRNNTKCMVKVNGVSLIDRLLHQLECHSLSRIVVVVGYEGQKLIDYINGLGITTPIVYVTNDIYDKTNNIYSLALVKDYLCSEDTLLFESDIIVESSVIDDLVKDERDTLTLVDKYESWMDGTCVTLSEDDTIETFVPSNSFDYSDKDKYYKTVNIYKFSKEFSSRYYVPFLEAYCKVLGENEYYEQVLRVITLLDKYKIKAKRLNGQRWYEIDDAQDLDIAESLFATDDEMRVKLMQDRFGGYWRYPKMLDFCYLVNPYFPPKKMLDEMKESFDTLLRTYPSGMKVNSLLAAKNFGVNQSNIVVGNGASELIKAVMERLSGVIGMARPVFEEYANRYHKEEIAPFYPDNADFSYSAQDIIDFYEDKELDNYVLVNPDNPSGNYIPKKDMLKLIEWAKSRKINLIVDESFVDFADEKDATLVKQDILVDNPHLFVIKSISKSYGVPGIRLGILASGDEEVINSVKRDVSIWNINSFAEFYMQIAEKYRKSYEAGLERFKAERKRFATKLNTIKGVRVVPSEANYFMLELTGAITSRELTVLLLKKYNILIKDLSKKLAGREGNYIRVAVRDADDNNKLVDALKRELMN